MNEFKSDRSGKYLTIVYKNVLHGEAVSILTQHPNVCALSWSHATHDVAELKQMLERATEQTDNRVDYGFDILPEELAALRRFAETCEDNQPYDVSREMMRRLALIGLVMQVPSNRNVYQTTLFGDSILESVK